MTKFQSVLVRFVKGFLAGGLASIGSVLALGVTISSTSDLKKLGLSLLTAFVTGGLLAVQKYFSWTE